MINDKHLLNKNTSFEYKKSIEKAIPYILQFLKSEKFYSGEAEQKLLEASYLGSLENTNSLEEVLNEIQSKFLTHSIKFHHTNYLAHLNCPVLISSLVGELIASSVNTAVETWDQSTTATLIEEEIIKWITSEFKLPKVTADGVFTTGGSLSNQMALLIARDDYAYTHFGYNFKQDGLTVEALRFRIFCSEKAHFSIQKSAALIGLGYNAVIPVKTNDKFEMNIDDLNEKIENEKKMGNYPIAVIATFGTTDFGSFDDVIAIKKTTTINKMWLHIDAAYGGGFVLTNTHKNLFKGSYLADSITIDFHKTFFQPLCSSAFLLKNKEHFKYISHFADYLNPVESTTKNLVTKSLQTTRRFDALKLWFTLKVTGKDKIKDYLEYLHQLTINVHSLMEKKGCFELLHKPNLTTIVFRYVASDEFKFSEDFLNELNLHIKNSLFNKGFASIASTKVNKACYLKFTLLNPSTTLEDIEKVIEEIETEAHQFKKNKLQLEKSIT